MDDTSLDFWLRIDFLDSFFKARKSVYAEEKDIFYSTVFQVVKHSEPELASFFGTYCNAEDILV